MADVNRGDRPLSPHLDIYKPQWTWVPSITHRITGCGLAAGALLLVAWLLGASVGGAYFAWIDWIASSWAGLLVWFGSTWALMYHAFNGVRHLIWDSGAMFEIKKVEASAKAIAGGSILATLLIWIAILAF